MTIDSSVEQFTGVLDSPSPFFILTCTPKLMVSKYFCGGNCSLQEKDRGGTIKQEWIGQFFTRM
ncbi:hypothetical protein CROQUDRAFT_95782 [Cronartium quercuum f. sp. fusiforme G11]|uniref:Uncharacterized protein n=1 Tax=Cronartium quercuum f. sp. fusiforme G11 TaxID=708437 RepID=A0A9P6NDY2_9BASI|nr:hypothetical protein CROQUDRAFT_95782 [Cronartium quercuum f. sp. fusiforme G11]